MPSRIDRIVKVLEHFGERIQRSGGGVGSFILAVVNILIGLVLLSSPATTALAVPLVLESYFWRRGWRTSYGHSASEREEDARCGKSLATADQLKSCVRARTSYDLASSGPEQKQRDLLRPVT
jgi:hypothetical protein